jgi:hypothetical protein
MVLVLLEYLQVAGSQAAAEPDHYPGRSSEGVASRGSSDQGSDGRWRKHTVNVIGNLW